MHANWYMPFYHFLGTFVIGGVTLAYAALAVARMHPFRRRRGPR